MYSYPHPSDPVYTDVVPATARISSTMHSNHCCRRWGLYLRSAWYVSLLILDDLFLARSVASRVARQCNLNLFTRNHGRSRSVDDDLRLSCLTKSTQCPSFRSFTSVSPSCVVTPVACFTSIYVFLFVIALSIILVTPSYPLSPSLFHRHTGNVAHAHSMRSSTSLSPMWILSSHSQVGTVNRI